MGSLCVVLSHLKANVISSLTLWHKTAPALLLTPNDLTALCMCASSGKVIMLLIGALILGRKTKMSRNIATVFTSYCQSVLFSWPYIETEKIDNYNFTFSDLELTQIIECVMAHAVKTSGKFNSFA